MIETLPPALRHAVSPYTGLVRSVEECLAATAEPRLFQAACDVGEGEGLLGAPLDHLTGIGGSGRTRAEAAAAAVGEAVERYSASYVPHERLVVGSADELPEAVEPERFALFSEQQLSTPGFPYRRFDSRSVTTWVEGCELGSGRRALVPAELVYLAPAGIPGEPSIGDGTSSGLACGEHRDETLLRGLCEVLERDAFMLVWANRLSLPVLEPEDFRSLPEHALFAAAGLPHSAVDLSMFHDVPIVLAVVRAPEGHPGAVGVGAAAAPTVEQAWWKALAEAFACRSAGAKLALLEPYDPNVPVVRFEDHIRRYASHDYEPATAFVDAARARTRAAAVRPLEGASRTEQIEALCRRVEAAGSNAYAVDVTSPDVASLGLVVTRVLAPELCRLDVTHGARFLGGRRLYEAAAALGLRAEPLREEDVNPDPHPFP